MKRYFISTLLFALVAIACSQTSEPDPGKREESGGGPVAAGMCVQMSPEALKEQEFAFDGTVKSITLPNENLPEGDPEDSVSATFTVQTWFKGGPGAGGADTEVTLNAPVPFSAVSSIDFPELREGDRYLVSGAENFMHGCGFTKVHSETEVEVWKEAFAD